MTCDIVAAVTGARPCAALVVRGTLPQMESLSDTSSTAGKRDRFETVLAWLFIAYLAAASLALTTLMDVNEPKWFIIRTWAPAMLAAAVLRDVWRGVRVHRPGPIGAVALLFLAWHVVSWFVAANPGRALMRTTEVAGLVCTYFVSARVASDGRNRKFVSWALAVIGAVVSIYGVAQHLGRDFFPWQEHRDVLVSRGVSFYGHATFAASVLIQLIPIAIALAASNVRWFARLAAAVIAGLMLYHLSFSGARMATLAFVISCSGAAIWWVTRAMPVERGVGLRGRRVIAASLAVVLVAAVVGGVLVLRAWRAKGSDLFAIRQSSMALRVYTWETASRMVFAHPVLGVGANNYEIVSPQYWNRVEQVRMARHGRWMQQAHNEYLQTAAELGLPGVALLLTLFAYGLVMTLEVAARGSGREERLFGLGCAAAIVAIALDANITFSLQAPGSALVLWTVLGLVSASHTRLDPAAA